MKSSAILLVLVAGCCRPTAVAPVVRTAAPSPVAFPAPAMIATFPAPALAQPQRNVFAFRSVSISMEDRRSRLSSPPVVVEHEGQARVPVLHRDRDLEARYLGAFGPQENPVLVFKNNGDVVNVALRKP
jgi:hypothetical protein